MVEGGAFGRLGLISAFELMLVLSVIGLLLILGVRLRIEAHTAVLLFIIAFLLLALISLSKLILDLLVVAILLGILCIGLLLRKHMK
jgi:endonuclease/exonuclease/phosphatase (EEP) superfamily protein YafD